MRAAFRNPWKEGMGKLRTQDAWLKIQHPAAAASLEESLEGLFTINRLDQSPALRRCLGTTRIIDSSHSAIRTRTRRLSRWKHAPMVVRWAAASFLDAEQRCRKILRYRDLGMLHTKLKDHAPSADSSKVAKSMTRTAVSTFNYVRDSFRSAEKHFNPTRAPCQTTLSPCPKMISSSGVRTAGLTRRLDSLSNANRRNQR